MKKLLVLFCAAGLIWIAGAVSEQASSNAQERSSQAEFAAPDVAILSPDRSVTSVNQRRLLFRALLISYASDLKEVILSLNNNPVDRVKLGDKPQRKYVLERELTLEEGVNVISVVAANKAASSKPVLRRITFERRAVTKPNLFILSVGISNYKDPDLKVKFADNDAEAVVQALEAQAGEGKLFGEIKKQVLLNNRATRSEILKSLDWLNSATSDDTRVLFLSGATLQDFSGNGYFLSAEHAPASDPAINDVPYHLFWAKLANSEGRAIIFIDMDQSLSRGRSGVADLAKKYGYKGLILTYVAFSEGEAPITARAEWRQRAFTRALLEGLAGAADSAVDGSKDGVINAHELGIWLRKRVSELTEGQQHPLYFVAESSPIFTVSRLP